MSTSGSADGRPVTRCVCGYGSRWVPGKAPEMTPGAAWVGMVGPNCNRGGLELSQGLLQGPWLEQIYRPVLRGTDRCASCQICG